MARCSSYHFDKANGAICYRLDVMEQKTPWHERSGFPVQIRFCTILSSSRGKHATVEGGDITGLDSTQRAHLWDNKINIHSYLSKLDNELLEYLSAYVDQEPAHRGKSTVSCE